MKYDVIIVNYNGAKIIDACLESVLNSSIKPNRIIIYDNNSSDKSIEQIKKLESRKIFLIEGSKNIGFGPGNNEALKEATSEFVLFMNNDLLLEKRCAEELLAAIGGNKKIALANPLIIKGWNKKDKNNIYSFGAAVNKAGFGYSLIENKHSSTNLSCFSGACFMARTSVIKKIGFEKSFFLYYEEPAISIILLKRGLRIARTLKAKCYHLESYSSPQKQAEGIAFRQFYGIQNRWFLLGKHWPLKLLPYALFINILHLLYFILFYIINKKYRRMSLIYIAPSRFIAGILRRDDSQTKSKKWYKILRSDSYKSYLSLGKKVLSK